MAKLPTAGFAEAVCDALGLDVRNVTKLNVAFSPGGVVTVDAEMVALDERQKALATAVRRFHIHAVEERKEAPGG